MSDKRIFIEVSDPGVDLNASSVSTVINMQAYKKVSYQLALATGLIGLTVVTIQGSNDGTNFVNTAATLTGVGLVALDDFSFKFARLAVTTLSGAAATADITGIAKA